MSSTNIPEKTTEKKSSDSLVPLILGLGVVIILTLGSTIYAGLYLNRWGDPEYVKEAAAKLDDIPMRIGNWEATEDETLSNTDFNMLKLVGYKVRKYRNLENPQEVVAAIIMIGPTGTISVHTPEVCFGNGEYKIDGSPKLVSIDNGDTLNKNHFKKLTFTNKLFGDVRLFYYSLGDGKDWQAVDDARINLGMKYAFMYKLQCEAIGTEEVKSQGDMIERFLKDFLPAVQPHLDDMAKK